jgi:peptidoglycan/xylan/chitin deacetylase (PgdA/CDA1 family)
MLNPFALKSRECFTFVLLNFWYFIGKTFLPKLTWRREVTEKVVYLTFDDGPHPTITPWVMEELEKVGAKGTFFVVGENAERYPDTLAEVRAKGHVVANHTHHHIKGWRNSKQVYLKDIEDCAKVLGSKRLFRPPFGQINFKAIDELKLSYELIMWDVLTKDYLKMSNRKYAMRRIKRATTSGSIIVFHDSEKAEKNLKALLPKYLEFLKEEGYKMETL